MKYVTRYETDPEQFHRVGELFPAHQALWHSFREDGTLLLIGPMADPMQGAMAVFATREAADAFVAADPFVTEGLVSRVDIWEWNEVLQP